MTYQPKDSAISPRTDLVTSIPFLMSQTKSSKPTINSGNGINIEEHIRHQHYNVNQTHRAGTEQSVFVDRRGGLHNPSVERMSRSASRRLERVYGINESTYQQMLVAQGGVCKICGRHQRYRKLSVDHRHSDGKVRSLLCNSYNRTIGFAYESPFRLRKAAEYLEQHNGIKETPNV